MHSAIDSLKLDRLFVVYPGDVSYVLRAGTEVVPLPLARERILAAMGRRVIA